MAGKAAVQAEIDDVRGYLTLYAASAVGAADGEAQLRKQHAKDLYKSKDSAVRCVANMIVMHTMMESGQKIPEELEEGVKHFSELLTTMMGNVQGQGPLNWRKERDVFITACKKLATASKEVVDHTDISYEDLATGVAESISSNDYPETLEIPKTAPVAATAVEAEPEQFDEPEEEVFEEEKATAEEVYEETAPEEETPAGTVEETVIKPDYATEAQEESTVAEGEEDESKRGGRGGRGRGRGERGNRGDYRGDYRGANRGDRGAFRGERGAFRGERAERGERGAFRGDRGDRGRGGRPRGTNMNWRGRNGEDNEGFMLVKEDGDTSGRGRGRGMRGDRGDRGDRPFRPRGERGAWRGGEGGEGAPRGGPRPPRGDRPPRTRGAKPEGGDLPGVATAVSDPAPVPETKE